MYNRQIETFIKVADIGSFNKASQELYIASSSIIKQINSLENRLEVTLFERTPQGLKLTEAGQIIYNASKNIIQIAELATSEAQNAKNKENLIIRLGTSPITPGDLLIHSWSKVKEHNPYTKLQIIPYQNSMENAQHILKNLGADIDLVIGILDERMLSYFQCNGLELYKSPVKVAVPNEHPLADKNLLTCKDLNNENIYIIQSGLSSSFDEVRKYIQSHCKSNIKDIETLRTEDFNEAENSNNLILSIEELDNIHPLMKLIDVDWDFRVPIGVFYPEKPSQNIKNILEILKEEVFN